MSERQTKAKSMRRRMRWMVLPAVGLLLTAPVAMLRAQEEAALDAVPVPIVATDENATTAPVELSEPAPATAPVVVPGSPALAPDAVAAEQLTNAALAERMISMASGLFCSSRLCWRTFTCSMSGS